MKKIILILILVQSILFAQASVWEVKKNGETVFLGGTIHLLRAQDYPLPKEFDKAYNYSDLIYFETDLEALEQKEMQKKIIDSMLLKNGDKLSTLLSPKVYEEIKLFAKSKGINILQFENFKPSMLVLTLTIMELKSMGIKEEGVDKFFLLKALKDGKQICELESVENHISYLANMGKGNEDNLVTQSLKDLNHANKYFKKIIYAWKNGNIKTLDTLFVKDMRKYTPKLYDTILVERNNNWMPIIKSLFKNATTEFILVGVAHLAGKDGIISKLRKQGYNIKKLKL